MRSVLKTCSNNIIYQRFNSFLICVNNEWLELEISSNGSINNTALKHLLTGKFQMITVLITCGSLYSNQLDTWGRRGSDLWDVGNLDLVTLICRPRSADLDLLITKDIAPGY